jgi:hypothetical protein
MSNFWKFAVAYKKYNGSNFDRVLTSEWSGAMTPYTRLEHAEDDIRKMRRSYHELKVVSYEEGLAIEAAKNEQYRLEAVARGEVGA